MQTKPINVRLDESLENRVETAVKFSGMPRADILRMAISQGLKVLESINYDLDGAITEKAERVKTSLESLPAPEIERQLKANY